MDNNMTPLELSDTFKFSCSENVPCFNECCQDLNQFLTPYDILRLKNRLGLTSGLFLERFTSQHTGPESGLPIITFKADYARELQCPFDPIWVQRLPRPPFIVPCLPYSPCCITIQRNRPDHRKLFAVKRASLFRI